MNFLLNNLPLKLLSLGLAALTILAVHLTGSNFYPIQVKAEVSVENLSDGLAIANPEQIPSRVDLSLQVPNARIDSVRARSFTAVVDLGGFSSPGSYQVPLELPDLGSDVVVTRRLSPVEVRLERKETKPVEVRARELGNLPSSLIKGSSSVEPQFIRATGPHSYIERLSHAMVEVPLRSINSSTERRLEVQLVLQSPDERVSPAEVPLSLNRTEVDYRIEVKNQENLVVLQVIPPVTGEPPAGYRVNNVTISPRRVLVPAGLLEGVDVRELETAPVDVSDMTEDTTVTQRIRYPFQPTADLPANAEVTIGIFRSSSGSFRQVEVGTELIGGSEDYEYTLNPQQVEVYVPQNIQLEASELRTLADVEGLAEGQHQLEVTAYYEGEERNWQVRPGEITVDVTAAESEEQ